MEEMKVEDDIDVSIILPMYNAQEWIEECLQSVLDQTFHGNIELSIYNDGSTDETCSILDSWLRSVREIGSSGRKLKVAISGHKDSAPRGVGYAKNQAVHQSHGKYLCFLDADDIMKPDRIRKQFQAASDDPDLLFGSKFERLPQIATERYTAWANSLTPDQLYNQVYLSHGPTLVMPTWFCARKVFDNVGGFDETGKGTAEDLIFFYRHLDLGGRLCRVDEVLLVYRFHPLATTFSVSEDTIWQLRLARLEEKVLKNWTNFTIWNAGKQGRKFYRCLQPKNRNNVTAMCDVDRKKINKGVYVFENSESALKPKIPIVHYSEAKPPFIICVKLGLTNGQFEQNLASLNLKEGKDYYHFN